MTDSPSTTPSPLDIVQRLYVPAAAAEVAIAPVDRPLIACIARRAADEIARLRRRAEGLTARLDGALGRIE